MTVFRLSAVGFKHNSILVKVTGQDQENADSSPITVTSMKLFETNLTLTFYRFQLSIDDRSSKIDAV